MSVIVTRAEKWESLPEKERYLIRRCEILREIETRLNRSLGAWRKVKRSYRSIIAETFVELAIRSTLQHDILVGSVKRKVLEGIVSQELLIEQAPATWQGGLPGTKRRKF